MVPHRRHICVAVGFRQLAERRARSDGRRPARGRDRCGRVVATISRLLTTACWSRKDRAPGWQRRCARAARRSPARGGDRTPQPRDGPDDVFVGGERVAHARGLRAGRARLPPPRPVGGSGHRMKVALRDDDTSFFTAPEQLHAVYDDVWDRIPVCLATVPFAIGFADRAFREEHWHTGASFPLEQNRELVDASALVADVRVRSRCTAIRIRIIRTATNSRPRRIRSAASRDGLRICSRLLGTPHPRLRAAAQCASRGGLAR